MGIGASIGVLAQVCRRVLADGLTHVRRVRRACLLLPAGIKTEYWYYSGDDFCGDLVYWTHAILATKDGEGPLVHSARKSAAK